MKISGEHHYDVPRDRLWKALLDPGVLSRTLPGCEDLEQTADNEFAGKLKMKVGPEQGVFDGKVALSEIDPPNGYRMKIEGRGAPGFMNGDGLLRLEEKDGGTTLHYEIEAQVGGRIASVGQRLLDSSAKVITRQGLEGLARQVEAPEAPEASESASHATAGDPDASPPSPPSQAQFAGSFLTGLLGELVPRERRPLVVVAAVLVTLTLIAVFLRTCAG